MMTCGVWCRLPDAADWRDCAGRYIDKVGRRKGLIVTLSIMAAGTFLMC